MAQIAKSSTVGDSTVGDNKASSKSKAVGSKGKAVGSNGNRVMAR